MFLRTILCSASFGSGTLTCNKVNVNNTNPNSGNNNAINTNTNNQMYQENDSNIRNDYHNQLNKTEQLQYKLENNYQENVMVQDNNKNLIQENNKLKDLNSKKEQAIQQQKQNNIATSKQLKESQDKNIELQNQLQFIKENKQAPNDEHTVKLLKPDSTDKPEKVDPATETKKAVDDTIKTEENYIKNKAYRDAYDKAYAEAKTKLENENKANNAPVTVMTKEKPKSFQNKIIQTNKPLDVSSPDLEKIKTETELKIFQDDHVLNADRRSSFQNLLCEFFGSSLTDYCMKDFRQESDSDKIDIDHMEDNNMNKLVNENINKIDDKQVKQTDTTDTKTENARDQKSDSINSTKTTDQSKTKESTKDKTSQVKSNEQTKETKEKIKEQSKEQTQKSSFIQIKNISHKRQYKKDHNKLNYNNYHKVYQDLSKLLQNKYRLKELNELQQNLKHFGLQHDVCGSKDYEKSLKYYCCNTDEMLCLNIIQKYMGCNKC